MRYEIIADTCAYCDKRIERTSQRFERMIANSPSEHERTRHIRRKRRHQLQLITRCVRMHQGDVKVGSNDQ